MSVAPRRAGAVRTRSVETIALNVPMGYSGLRASPRAFWRLCGPNGDLRLERTARGEVIVMPPAGSDSGMRNAGLTAQVWNWTKADGTGVAFDSSTGFTLPNGAVRSPDASWIARDRWMALPAKAREKFAPICPDFVVELRSPTDGLMDARVKMREYIDQGVRLGVYLDPETGLVEIYRPGRPVETLHHPATVDAGDVLPGFVLDLRDILAD